MSLRDDLVLQAQLYAEGAPVAQGTERPASNREVAGSSPAGGATPASKVHAALEGFAASDRRMARCEELSVSDLGVGLCNHRLSEDGLCPHGDQHVSRGGDIF